ncbi:MAG: DUF4136 domain-containing protein [Janthinobacterium lividum]
MSHLFCTKARKAFTAASLATVFVASAAAQRVSTDFDHKANFQQYHTFSLYKVQASSPLVEQRLRDALVHDLSARGLEMVSQGGDLAVTAIGSRKDQQEYNTFYQGLGGGGYGWGGRGFGGFGGRFGGGFGNDGLANTQVINVPVGSLVVDVYDGSKHQLLFRGVASDTLSSKEEKNTKKLQKSVSKIFDKYPSGNAR